jgi:LuxR family maltose regulon positive regulatory protein
MAPRNAEGQPEAESLIDTKLRTPPSRNDVVSRSEVVELLRAGSHRKLTLLSAPAGYGKTTLLAEWHAADAGDHQFAWLSLDLQDDDMVRFWTYVIEALRKLHPGGGSGGDPRRAARVLGRRRNLDEHRAGVHPPSRPRRVQVA